MIKFLVMDVDGTLTDGKIYMGVDGECMKAFDIKDGYALHTLLKENDIIPVIITARKSPMVEHRCKELGVKEIHQGVMNKLDCLKEIILSYSSKETTYDFSNVAYIGDDLLDLQCMNPIKEAGGVTGCPVDAVKEVISVCDFVSTSKGGEGAVRDFAEYLMSASQVNDKNRNSLEKRCIDVASYLSCLKGDDLSIGRHNVSEDFFYNVCEYETDNNIDKYYESHFDNIDIQLIVSGEEIMQVTDISNLKVAKPYNKGIDSVYYRPDENTSGIILRPGSVMMLFPKDAHRTIAYMNPIKVKKIVGKIKIL